jgi:TonB family protein
VELDEGNGGIVLNVSEGGLSVQAVASLKDELLPRVRFQLTHSPNWIETSARVTWATESGKLAGLEFIDLSDEARGQIRKWLSGEEPSNEERNGGNAGSGFPAARDVGPGVVTTVTALDTEPDSLSLQSEANPATAAEQEPAEPTASAEEASEPFTLGAVPSFGYSSRSDSAPRRAQDFKFGMIGEPARPAVDEPKGNDLRVLAVFIGFLALVSLAAGWAAGHGTAEKVMEKLRSMSAAKPGAHEVVATPPSPVARISQIEVVNLNNQEWTIPFDTPSGTAQQGARTDTPGSGGRGFSRPAAGFNTWVLSPPTRAPVADGTAVQDEAPPAVVPETPSAPDTGAASPLVANSIALQSVVPKPEVRQSLGIVKRGELIHRVEPIYPVLAREQRTEGTVRLNVSLGEDGSVRKVTVLGGPPLLLQAAADAVKQWKYAPTTLDGRPIESDREVSLVFHL